MQRRRVCENQNIKTYEKQQQDIYISIYIYIYKSMINGRFLGWGS